MHQIDSEVEEALMRALGQATVRTWSRLPAHMQHALFEGAVTVCGEAIRQPLAVYLHDRHARTSARGRRDTVEPDSLGG